MTPYSRSVHYYETDMMGVVHHANYIHWMEEARIDFMDRLGFPYRKMEEEGVLSPVKSVSVDYKKPSTFGDEIGLSQIMIAIDPEKFQGKEVTDRIVDTLIEDIHSSEPIREGGKVFYPGEIELQTRRDNLENGIPVIDEKWEELKAF